MASITRESNGRRTIQFVAKDGKRRSIRLGKVPQSAAEAVKVKVERLVAASIIGHALDGETARWVAELDSVMADKLAAVGLVAPRESFSGTLGDFLDRYFETRIDVKPLTIVVWGHTKRCLIEFFGADRPLKQITEGDADEWRLHLIGQRLADSTIRKRCGFAKQFFASAVKRKLIPSNPFAHLKSAAKGNPERFYFVMREQSDAVLAACPDAQWRLLFALSRYGGLRCPSEHLALKWGDVDWERNRMRVTSPKTEYHEGKGSRFVPLFPELRPYLEAVFDEAPVGSEHVITRYRQANANLRTQLERIIRRAGLEPWGKLFQNLRSTRQTELEETFPLHVVCTWMGNSEPVAKKHYLQVTEEHFAKAVQNPVQHAPELHRVGSQVVNTPNEKSPVLPGIASDCDAVQCTEVEDRALEP